MGGLQLSGEAAGTAQRAELERLQGAWEQAECEKSALQAEIVEVKSALKSAQDEREGMEAILEQTEKELNEVRGPTNSMPVRISGIWCPYPVCPVSSASVSP